MNEQALRFRLGLFVLGILIILGVLIILFGGFPHYFKPSDSFTIEFQSAQGIAPGTPVRRSGVRIGEVRTITLDNETGKVQVTIQVESGYSIRRCDRATVVHGLLGTDSAIAFVPPGQDEKNIDTRPVEPGATLEGQIQADPGKLVQQSSELMPFAREALAEFKNAFQGMDKMAPKVEESLKDFRDVAKALREIIPELRELTKTVKTAVPDFRRTSEEIQITARTWSKLGERLDLVVQNNEPKFAKTMDRLQDSLKQVSDLFNPENQKIIQEILKNLRAGSVHLDSLGKSADDLLKESKATAKRINETLARSDELVANLQKASKPLAERSPSIFKNLDESTDKLNQALADLRELLRAFGRGEGTIQKMLTEPGLYNNLNDSAAMVTRILPRVEYILRDLEIFADKLARHPESLGLGGMIRPGTGLKEAPTYWPYRPIWP